jgi:hypothetical protein
VKRPWILAIPGGVHFESFAAAMRRIGCPLWIQNKDGDKVQFKRNYAQRKFCASQ